MSKKQHEATYNFTLSQLEGIKEKATQEAVIRMMNLMMGIPAMVLRDKFGFGKTRMERFLNEVIDLWTSYNDDYLTLEDIQSTLNEEGFKVRLPDPKVVKGRVIR